MFAAPKTESELEIAHSLTHGFARARPRRFPNRFPLPLATAANGCSEFSPMPGCRLMFGQSLARLLA
jgi:hypothetical protein